MVPAPAPAGLSQGSSYGSNDGLAGAIDAAHAAAAAADPLLADALHQMDAGAAGGGQLYAVPPRCIVCMQTYATHVFAPCGHQNTCEKCAERIVNTSRSCPLCRVETMFTMRVFSDRWSVPGQGD